MVGKKNSLINLSITDGVVIELTFISIRGIYISSPTFFYRITSIINASTVSISLLRVLMIKVTHFSHLSGCEYIDRIYQRVEKKRTSWNV